MANLYITGTDGWLGSRLIEVASADHKVTPFKGDVRNANDCDAFFDQASWDRLADGSGITEDGTRWRDLPWRCCSVPCCAVSICGGWPPRHRGIAVRMPVEMP